MNVESRSASGTRPLARSPPSSDGISARNSTTPLRTSSGIGPTRGSITFSSPTPAAVRFVPHRFIAPISTKPPSSRRRDSTNDRSSPGRGTARPSTS